MGIIHDKTIVRLDALYMTLKEKSEYHFLPTLQYDYELTAYVIKLVSISPGKNSSCDIAYEARLVRPISRTPIY